MTDKPLAIVVLISGRGSNLRAIIDACDRGLAVDIRCVISNRADAPGLDYARNHAVPVTVIPAEKGQSRENYDRRVMEAIDHCQPDLVVLAGYMRIMSADMVNHYTGSMINIHPSLLPAFKGLQTHAQALAAGVSEHGASVHFVTPELDDGPVIAQSRVAVLAGDTVESLARRVLQREHQLYPTVLSWFQAGRIQWRDQQILFDGLPLEKPVTV